jgi:hypothetical protein
MYNIKLPQLDWLMSGNVFTGSLGTDIENGCMNNTTFNFKVAIVKTKGDSFLFASYYFKLPWNASSNIDEVTICRFQPSEFGIEIAENWLLSKYYMPYNNLSQSDKAMLLTTNN